MSVKKVFFLIGVGLVILLVWFVVRRIDAVLANPSFHPKIGLFSNPAGTASQQAGFFSCQLRAHLTFVHNM